MHESLVFPSAEIESLRDALRDVERERDMLREKLRRMTLVANLVVAPRIERLAQPNAES